MPQIEKLVPVDGRLGVVLDVPLEQLTGSVSIYTDEEVAALIARAKRGAQDEIIERITARLAQGKCHACMGWDCAKDIADTIRNKP